METLKWDGVSHKQELTAALMWYIDDDDKELAKHTSYGDLGKALQNKHGRRFHGAGNDDIADVTGETSKITIAPCKLRVRYELTWNKAAKLIHEYINGGEAKENGDMAKYFDEALNFWSGEVENYKDTVMRSQALYRQPESKVRLLRAIFNGAEDQEFRCDGDTVRIEGRGIVRYEGKTAVEGVSWDKFAQYLDKSAKQAQSLPAAPQNQTNDNADAQIVPAKPVQIMSDNAQYAYNVHAQIIMGAQMVENGLYQMAKGFKIMRDDKLYKELGYKSFEDYCESATGIKRSQVYNYIKIVEKISENEFVQPVGQIGMRKLLLLAAISEEQRAEIAGNTDLESTTVKELQAKIDELTGKHRALEDDYADLAVEADKLTAERDALREKGEKLDKNYQMLTDIHNDDVKEAKRLKDMIAEQTKQLREYDVTGSEKYKALAAERDELEGRVKELESKPIEVQGVDEKSILAAEFEIKFKAAYEYVRLAGLVITKAEISAEKLKMIDKMKDIVKMIDAFTGSGK